MYKITLYDNNCCPICDGVISFYVDNLEEFEKKWLPLQVNQSIATVDRYYRSKHGEIVTDYYTEDESYNIVQEDKESRIVEEKGYNYKDVAITLYNAYSCGVSYEFDTMQIILRKICYKGEYKLVGKYKIKGCRRISLMFNRYKQEETKYDQVNFYGNPIATHFKRDIEWNKLNSNDAYADFMTNDKNFYKDEEIETFVWLYIKDMREDEEIKELSEEEKERLLRDIIGEAG